MLPAGKAEANGGMGCVKGEEVYDGGLHWD